MIRTSLAAVGLSCLMATAANAGLTFDTISGTTAVGAVGSSNDSSTYIAASFSVVGAPDFNSVSLNLISDNDANPGDATDTGSVMVYLVADDGSGGGNGIAGVPDASNSVLLGSIADSTLSSSGSIVTINGPKNAISTLAGQAFADSQTTGYGTNNNEYWIWLDLTNSSGAEWLFNADDSGIGTAGQSGFDDQTSVWDDAAMAIQSQGALQMQVDTPEPASVAIVGAALAGLGYLRRRRGAVSSRV